jgi:hypothetical protein
VFSEALSAYIRFAEDVGGIFLGNVDKNLTNTARSRVFPEKVVVPHLIKKFPPLIESEVPLPHSPAPVTCAYPEPDQSSPRLPSPLLEDDLHDIKFWTITVFNNSTA